MTAEIETEVSNECFFNHLVELYSPRLYRCALSLCHDPTQAEDLVQDTYLRAWRFIANLRDLNAAESWLFTILRREHARCYERPQMSISDIELEKIPVDPTHDEANAELTLLQSAAANLPQAYREPLMLCIRGGSTCEQIGKILDLSPGAVWTRLHRARKLLASQLKHHSEVPEQPHSSRFKGRSKTTNTPAGLGLN